MFTHMEPLLLLYDNRRDGPRTIPVSTVLNNILSETPHHNEAYDTRYHQLLSTLISQRSGLGKLIHQALKVDTPKTLTNILVAGPESDPTPPVIKALTKFFEARMVKPDSEFQADDDEYHGTITECKDGDLAWAILEHTIYPLFHHSAAKKTQPKKMDIAKNIWRTITLVRDLWSEELLKHEARTQIYRFWKNTIYSLFTEPDEENIYPRHAPWFLLTEPEKCGELDEMDEMELTTHAVQVTAKDQIDQKTAIVVEKFLKLLKELGPVAIPDVDNDTLEPRLLPGMEHVAKDFLTVSIRCDWASLAHF